MLHDQEHKKVYATGGRTKVPIYVTGVIEVDNAEIAVLDSDLGNLETQKKYATLSLNLEFFCSIPLFSNILFSA